MVSLQEVNHNEIEKRNIWNWDNDKLWCVVSKQYIDIISLFST